MRMYLDYNATTPLAPEAADAMSRALREVFGNPSSVHAFGQQAKAVLDEARQQVAALVGGDASEVVFTSGGTESDGLALRGAVDAMEAAGRREIVVSAIEHEAVLNTARALAKRGVRVSIVPPQPSGIVDPARVAEHVTDRTAVVSVMHANNETGAIQPVAAIAEIARARGALVHVDAVQTAGKIPIDVQALGVDLLSLSAHKFYGPKGAGALWIRRGTRLVAQMTGGRQERARRAGTENVPAIAGFGAAAARARTALARDAAHVTALRDRLEAGVCARVEGAVVNAAGAPRVGNTSNVGFPGVEAESLLIALDLEGIAVSTGSACSSGTLEPSHVLKAMGVAPSLSQGSLRFSLGAPTTAQEIDRVLDVLPSLVEKLRSLTRTGSAPRA
jgi:cysteine desulfurase